MKYEITNNTEFNSIEIAFDGKPSEAVRDSLKALRFRWHSVKRVWYGYADEEAVRNAIEGKPVAKAPKAKAEKVNKFGVKVGDVFRMSWGYDQTNVDFFQVVALVGEQSVRVIEVNPEITKEDAYAPMCADRTYNITPEIMPKARYSVHLKDKDNGDVKRVCKSGETLYLNMSSYANAYKIPFGLDKEYVSWYA